MDNTEENIIILKDSIRYSISTYIMVVFGIITGLATRRILGPVMMGTFTQLMIIFQYSKYHHAGIFNALERELPYYNGRRDTAKVEEIKNVGFSATTLTSFAVALGIISASFMLKLDGEMLVGIKILAASLVVQSAVSFLTVLVKTHHRFGLLSKYNILTATLQAFLTIYMGLRFDLFGILWVSVIIGSIGALYLLESRIRFKFVFPFSGKEVIRLLSIGTPLLINDVALVSLMNMDKFSIIKYFGKAELGYYSIASMLANYLYLLPNLIYAVLFPRFYESFGRVGDIKKLRHYLESPTLIISYFISGITACMILFLPFLMKYILPSYTPGIACAKILLFGMFFVSLQGMSSYILVVMNRQRLMILLSLFGISLAAFFNHIFVNVLGWNIEGVATAMAATYFIYTTVFISNAFKYHSSKPSDLLAFLAKIYAPFIWLIAVAAVLGLASPCSGASLKSDLLTLSAKGAILALSYIPMLYYLNKTTGIMNKIFKMIRSGFKARK